MRAALLSHPSVRTLVAFVVASAAVVAPSIGAPNGAVRRAGAAPALVGAPAQIPPLPPTVDKTRTTSVNEAGNRRGNEASIGETVSYTITLDLPAPNVFENAVLSDRLNAEKDLQVGTVVAQLDGGPTRRVQCRCL